MPIPSLGDAPARRRALVLGARGYALLVVALGSGLLAATPIVPRDFDLWYHLAHGRHLYAHGEPPASTAPFSYLEPRSWVVYYWGFQAVVYPLFRLGGYPLLLLFRALVYAATVGLAAALVLRRARDPARAAGMAFVVGLTACNLLARAEAIRPHLVTYLCLALSLWLLETRSRATALLPLVALVWVNGHGVAYPVMLLVIGAYLLETLIERTRDRSDAAAPAARRRLIAFALSALAVAATPWGRRLFPVPFLDTTVASEVIGELQPFSPQGLFSYGVSLSQGLLGQTPFRWIVVLAIAALLVGLKRRRLEPAPLVLAAGGVFLLTRGIRFVNELNLLVLPLLERAFATSPAGDDGEVPPASVDRALRAPATAAIAVALLLPVITLARVFADAPASYPLDDRRLPIPTVRFLNDLAAGGEIGDSRLFHDANAGGYLLFTLDRRYRISLTLELPLSFHDEELYALLAAFEDPVALDRYLARYSPDFLLVPLFAERFPALVARHPRYRKVFFDDAALLYVDATAHPGIAAEHALALADPFLLAKTPLSSLPPPARAALAGELETILARAPVRLAAESLAILQNLDGRPAAALATLTGLLAAHPDLATAESLRGDALQALGRCDAAIGAYRRALAGDLEPQERKRIERARAPCLATLGRHDEAYASLEDAVGLVNPRSSRADLELLATYAHQAGKLSEARTLLRFALAKAPPGSADEGRLRELLERIEGAGAAASR